MQKFFFILFCIVYYLSPCFNYYNYFLDLLLFDEIFGFLLTIFHYFYFLLYSINHYFNSIFSRIWIIVNHLVIFVSIIDYFLLVFRLDLYWKKTFFECFSYIHYIQATARNWKQHRFLFAFWLYLAASPYNLCIFAWV